MKLNIAIFLIILSFFGFSDFLSFTKEVFRKSIKEGLTPMPQGSDLLRFQRSILKDKNDNFNGYLIEAGKILYFDPRLSNDGTKSCNTCHNLSFGGTSLVSNNISFLHNEKFNSSSVLDKKLDKKILDAKNSKKSTAKPSKAQLATLNPPSIYNVIFNKRLHYDASFVVNDYDIKGIKRNTIAQVVLNSLVSKIQMDSNLENITDIVNSSKEYRILFKKAYGNVPIDSNLIVNALAAFISTLNTPNRFDDFLNGDLKVLSKDEIRGLSLFIEKGCTDCHNGVNLGGEIGILGVREKYKFSNITNSKGSSSQNIKVPTLRNINNTAPYFHDGAFLNLDDAIYEMGRIQLGIKLNKAEIESIRTFFNALDAIYPVVNLPYISR